MVGGVPSNHRYGFGYVAVIKHASVAHKYSDDKAVSTSHINHIPKACNSDITSTIVNWLHWVLAGGKTCAETVMATDG
jgi:hypothetical protein